MKEILNQVVFVIIVFVVIYVFLNNPFDCGLFRKNTVPGKTSDTTKNTVVKITETESFFTAEQVGNIKKVLIDSLNNFYGKRIVNLISDFRSRKVDLKQPNDSAANDHLMKVKPSDYCYVSEIDSSFVSRDSSGFVTDSMHIKSTFISLMPISGNSVHLLSLAHKSFNKESETIIKTNDLNSVYQYPEWCLNIGALKYFNAGFTPSKYISLTYTKNILLDFSSEAGFYNNINSGLNNFQLFVKAEFKIKL